MKIVVGFCSLIVFGLVGCSERRENAVQPPGQAIRLSVYDVDAKHATSVRLQHNGIFVRFCGCPPCIEYARKVPLGRRSLAQHYLFTGSAESLIEFRKEVGYPNALLKYVEYDDGWEARFDGRTCPVAVQWNNDTQSFRTIDYFTAPLTKVE